jgi:hypothetical protein
MLTALRGILPLIPHFREMNNAPATVMAVNIVEGDGIAGGRLIPDAFVGDDFRDDGAGGFEKHGYAFVIPEAGEAPLGEDHAVNEDFLSGCPGEVIVIEFVADFEEVFAGFVGEEDGFRHEAVFEAVGGGLEFAMGRDGAFGLGSIGAGGGALGFGAWLFPHDVILDGGWCGGAGLRDYVLELEGNLVI